MRLECPESQKSYLKVRELYTGLPHVNLLYAEAALRKYADAKNWKCSLCVHDAEHVDGICCNDFFEPTLDGYEIARQALKESKDETR